MPPLPRRAFALGLPALLVAPTACGPSFQRRMLGGMDDDAKPFAFQYGSTSENSASLCATSARRRLIASTPDGARFLTELARTQQRLELDIRLESYESGTARFDGQTVSRGTMAIEGVKMRASYSPSNGKAPPGKRGPPKVSVGGFEITDEPKGIAPDVVDKGQNAVFGVPYEMNGINAMIGVGRNFAFEMLVMKKRLEMGQKADYRIPDRPADKSIADVDLALALIAMADAALNRWRASMILLMAVYASGAKPDVQARLEPEATLAADDMKRWLDEHPLMTSQTQLVSRIEAYGMGPKPLILPTPMNLLAMLDENGYVAAAVKVAQGIATGSIADTVQGLSKFAPKDSSARTAMEGIAAASRGDFAACADAVGKLAGTDVGVGALRDRIAALRRE